MRVVKVEHVHHVSPIPVCDLTAPITSNFKLAVGPVVHNSKDLSDAVCGAYTNMLERRSTWAAGLGGEPGEMDGRAGDDERFDGGRR